MNETFLKIHEFEPKKLMFIRIHIFQFLYINDVENVEKRLKHMEDFFVCAVNNEYFFWIHLEGIVL